MNGADLEAAGFGFIPESDFLAVKHAESSPSIAEETFEDKRPICPYCHERFSKKNSRQRTCLKVECDKERIKESNKNYRATHERKRTPKKARPVVDRFCRRCSVKIPKGIYCSKDCRAKTHIDIQAEKRKNKQRARDSFLNEKEFQRQRALNAPAIPVERVPIHRITDLEAYQGKKGFISKLRANPF